MRASRFSIDAYVGAAWRLFPRYARLGIALIGVYLVSALGYLAAIATRDPASGWGVTAAMTALFALWITIVNLIYLLVQIVIQSAKSAVIAAVTPQPDAGSRVAIAAR